MGTCNFRTQRDFPLFVTTIFDGYYYEDEETGATEWFDGDYTLFKHAESDIDELNGTLNYFELHIESGYYSGVQAILERKTGNSWHCYEYTDDYTADEWKKFRADEKKAYGGYYDFDLSYAERAKAERRERKKIEQFCRTKLKELYNFDEYVSGGVFSNGEATYSLATR